MTFTRTYSTTLERIVAEEIKANASQMIQQLTERPCGVLDQLGLEEQLIDCSQKPDYSEAPDGYAIWHDSEEGFYFRWWYSGPSFGWVEDEERYNTKREAIIAAWEDSGDEPEDIEALQHWIVSDWLAEKLEDIGALVSDDILGFAIWGRTECGQGLDQDSDLIAVAKLIDSK